jgi:predicted cupin superfamily sugar epimerase
MSAARWIRDLQLEPHPEGGFYRETQRSRRCTTIVYLLPEGQFSAWHRLRGADEVWHFYAGTPLSLWLLDDAGPREIVLGGAGGFHGIVPGETWQAARPKGDGWSLVGCTVAPAFTFDRFPGCRAEIEPFLRS